MNTKGIITLIILVVGIFFIFQALPQDNLVSVIEQEQEVENDVIETEEPVEITERTPDREICVGEYCDGSMSGEDDFTVVQVPLITSGGDVGCGDDIFFAPHVVEPKTKAVLDATYRTLFDLKAQSEIEADDIRNIVGSETELMYDDVTLNSGVATLQLSGRTRNVVHCAVPAFRAQIEQAAFQFDTVETLEVYINDERWDWCDYSDADPEEDGCDTTPKYWVTQKQA